MRHHGKVVVRNTRTEDFPQIIELSRAVYTDGIPWSTAQLASHLEIFPYGQFVAIDEETGEILGMASSLIIRWDDYDFESNWRDYTDHGLFTNHDPVRGRTLYGAEIMVHPGLQGAGIGSLLYAARRKLVEDLGLLRIRAAARLRGYHRYAEMMTADEYVVRVIRGELKDPTLSFQLKHGFDVLGVVSGYLHSDRESRGNAAVIEWINPRVATAVDFANRDPRFARPEKH